MTAGNASVAMTAASAGAVPASHDRRRIAANVAAMAASNGFGLIVTILISVWVRRALGPVAIGQVSWNMAVIAYLIMIANPGLQVVGQRELARGRDDAARLVSLILCLQVPLALIAYAAAVGVAALDLRGPQVSTLLLVQAVSLFFTAWNPVWALQAYERMVVPSLAALAFNALQLPILVFVVHGPGDVYLYVLCSLLPLLLTGGFNFWYLARCGLPLRSLRWTLEGARQCLNAAWPLALSGAAIVAYYNCGAIVLGFTHGDEAVGQYATAFRLMLVSSVVTTAIWGAYLPSLTRAQDNPAQGIRISRELIGLLAWLGFPIAALGWAFGRHVVDVMYGPAFAPSGVYFEWMCLNVPILFLNLGVVTALVAWGFQKIYFKITGAAAVVNIVLNLVTIPAYGPWGAIVSTTVAELMIVVLTVIVRRRHRIGWHSLFAIVPPALCSAAVAIAAGFLPDSLQHYWWLECAIAALLLGACLAVFERGAVLAVMRWSGLSMR
ncbi:MAG: flippase [Alphaproteobacteria bacterium]|nr:flippase [Alphaproteobacteria bacterium]